MSGVFSGCQITLDLTTSVKFKEKAKLRKSITDSGGIVSYIVTKKSTHVVCNDAEKADISYKVKMAAKYSIPVVSIAYIDKSVESGKLLNTDDYLIVGKTKSEELGSGKISASRYQKKEKKKLMKPLFNINSYKSWKADDKNCPKFSREFQVAKFAVFRAQKKERNKYYTIFTVLEVHIAEHVDMLENSDNFKFRVMSHSGTLRSVEHGDKGLIEYRFCSTSEEALFLYTHLYNEKLQAPYSMDHVHDMFSQHIGSEKFQQMMSELGLESETVSPPVGELVEHIWREAMGELESIISIPVTSVKSEQVEKAEAILKQIKEALDNNNSTGELVTEFYSLIPHHAEHRVTSPTKAWLSRKQDLCQLIKDMVSVSEATDWSMRSGTQSKYKALRCTIEHVASTDGQYKTLKNQFLTALVAVAREQDSSFEIQNIYAVTRPVENSNYTQEIDNKQFLYHSSRVENFVGIMSRGLMLPKVVVDDFGGTRSDPGMLGSGIYFASDPRTSVAYSTASKTKGTRLMLINEVALGNCLDKTQKDLTLTCAPEGYQSVHGVKATDEQPSDFKNDEFVVYRTEQQRIKYLVEFTVADDYILELEGLEDLGMDLVEDAEFLSQEIDLHDVKNVIDPMSKVKPGLVSSGDTPIDLKGVHIRAKLLDMASEVVVLQEYHNNSMETLEAKYVFPLGDMAAVCGFEAFINGKHIIGEVKEKETAHKEYKKAVSEGHGAYLMDQDEETPDVFTVSVGNLPPWASVLIKITYVAELQVEGELISFRLPGSVAPWKHDTAMKDITQHDTDTVEVKQGETTVQVAIEMPFDIRSIECSSNKVRVKKTLTKATVELLPNESIEDGFQLLVGLAEIHVPRMWVEKKTGDQDHQACMLSFYPEFEACEDDNVEVVFLLDLSNSMKGDNLRDAKKVLLLTLQQLPGQWYFNVVVFGTAFKELFPSCVIKNPSNLKKAAEFVKALSATMGNTEVIRPMHTFYLLRHESSIQNVFLISDGHINNEEAMLSNAMKHSQHTRIFTMGVSSTANRHLLRALARVGAGAYEFFDSKVKSQWEGKVCCHINKAAQPGLTSVSVDWEQHGADVPGPVQAPRQITALFSGSRQVVYGYVPNCLMATLKANIAGHEVSTVVSTSDLSTTEGKILHRLTARAIISDWQDGVLSPDRTDHEIVKMNTKNFIIELSKEYSIVTQFTSFVAIEKRDKDDVVSADAPTMAELVERENVDELVYMGFEKRKESVSSAYSESESGSRSNVEYYEDIGEYYRDFDDELECDEEVSYHFILILLG